MRAKPIAAETVMSLWRYDSGTGIFYHKRSGHGTRVGRIAGCVDKEGYRYLRTRGQAYAAHRIAWLYVTGAFPAKGIDHINGNKDDNRFVNLREATSAQNQWNVPGARGCFWVHERSRWRAAIKVNRKRILLGEFRNEADAREVYQKAKVKYHGEFAPKNRTVS